MEFLLKHPQEPLSRFKSCVFETEMELFESNLHVPSVLPTNVEQRIGNLSERGDFTDSSPNLNATRRHTYVKSIPRILYER